MFLTLVPEGEVTHISNKLTPTWKMAQFGYGDYRKYFGNQKAQKNLVSKRPLNPSLGSLDQ